MDNCCGLEELQIRQICRDVSKYRTIIYSGSFFAFIGLISRNL